jgi:DNA-binding NtrC family response regulator
MIQQGGFREDLFYRLNVIRIHVPSLRDRKQDIPALIDHFIARFSKHNADGNSNGGGMRRFSPEVLDVLTEYSWPGNVRELENVIERLIIRSADELLTVADLPTEIRTPGVALHPKRERRQTIADDLYRRLTGERESFWSAVYPLYMRRDITRENLRDLVRMGLKKSRGNYKIMARIFNLEPTEYKRFLAFLRKHDCQLPFKDYR